MSIQPSVFQSPVGLRFGQLFIGEQGQVAVIEPKYPTNKDAILYQHTPNEPIYFVGRHPLVKYWTEVVEQFGNQLTDNPFGLSALSQILRINMTQNGLYEAVPPIDRFNAANTMYKGRSSAFNNGIRLDLAG